MAANLNQGDLQNPAVQASLNNIGGASTYDNGQNNSNVDTRVKAMLDQVYGRTSTTPNPTNTSGALPPAQPAPAQMPSQTAQPITQPKISDNSPAGSGGYQMGLVTQTPQVPSGWSTQDYQSFKQANPNLEPDQEDVQAAKDAENHARTQKIMAQINAGILDASQIANATGIPQSDVADAINSSPDLSYMVQSSKHQSEVNTALDTFKGQMNEIRNGTFQLTDTENAQIAQVNQMYDQLKRAQMDANTSFQNAVMTNDIRAGRQEFLNTIASGNYQQAVSDGVLKIQKLDQEALKYTNELKLAFREERYKQAADLYDKTQSVLDQKGREIQTIHEETTKILDKQMQVRRDYQKEQQAQIAQQKLLQDTNNKLAVDIAPSIAASMTDNPETNKKMIDQISQYYNIEPLVLSGAAQKYADEQNAIQDKQDLARYRQQATEQTANQKASDAVVTQKQKFINDMSLRGFSQIDPKQAMAAREAGYEVVEQSGLAFAKEADKGNLQKTTYKGVTTWYDPKTGSKVNPTSVKAATTVAAKNGAKSSTKNTVTGPTLDKLLVSYDPKFKAYIKSIASDVQYPLNAKNIGDLYKQFNAKADQTKQDEKSANTTQKLADEQRKKAESDLAKSRTMLAKDPTAWGPAWDFFKNNHPDIKNETLDKLLNFDKYGPKK